MLPNKENATLFQLYMRSTDTRAGERAVHAITGIVEVPVGHIQDHTIGRFVPVISGDDRAFSGLHILPDMMSSDQAFPGHREQGFDTDKYLTAKGWPLSRDYDVGALLYRKIDIPTSRPDREAFSVVGMMSVRSISYSPDAIMVFAGDTKDMSEQSYIGRLGHEIDMGWDVPDMEAVTRGLTASQIVRTPVWGFSDEPYEMGPDTSGDHLRVWQEARKRIADGDTLDSLPGDLRDRLRACGDHMFRDGTYVSVLRYLKEHHPEHLDAEYRPRTRSQLAESSAIMRESVAAVVFGQEEVSVPTPR